MGSARLKPVYTIISTLIISLTTSRQKERDYFYVVPCEIGLFRSIKLNKC